jgi:hypothetical protein
MQAMDPKGTDWAVVKQPRLFMPMHGVARKRVEMSGVARTGMENNNNITKG